MHRTGAVLFAVAALAACASNSYRTAWKAPDARPLSIQSGEKVAGVVLTANESNRQEAEADLVAELDRRGLVGVAAHTLAPGAEGLQAEKLKPAIEASGAAAAVVMKVVEKGSMDAGGSAREPWNTWNWGPAYNAATPVAGMLFVETRVFDLEQGQLVWVGQSQVVSPSSVEKVIRDLVSQASSEMQKQGVLATDS